MIKITIRTAVNGYIADAAENGVEPMPPHVFESFDSLVAHLRSEFVPQNAKPLSPAPPTCGGTVRNAPSFPSDRMTGIYCDGCQGKCRYGEPVDADGYPKKL